MNTHNPQDPAGTPIETEGDIDFRKWARLLWGSRKWIVGTGLVFALLGAIFAFTTTPVYYAEAIISPKSAASNASVLSRLGGLGGAVATQIEAGNTPIDRLELILGSRSLARAVIVEYNLLPVLYPDRWDPKRRAWKGGKAPNLNAAAMYLRSGLLTFTSDRKKNAITLGIKTYDPKLAAWLVEVYLAGLSKNIRSRVREEADSSRVYLEAQLNTTSDPQIGFKIQQLMGQEIEKAALVSARAFDVIEMPWVPLGPTWPKKRPIIGIGLLLGLFLGAGGALVKEKVKELRNSTSDRG